MDRNYYGAPSHHAAPGYPHQQPPSHQQYQQYGGYGGAPSMPTDGSRMGAPSTFDQSNGFNPPPGIQAPGTAPPGMFNSGTPQGNFPAPFQPPSNMPGIDFNASVIRMGAPGGRKDGPENMREGMGGMGGRRGAGLGYDGRGHGGDRGERGGYQSAQFLVPPTWEETQRTLFVGDITKGCRGDSGMEKILSIGGGLRSFVRATDENYQPIDFGFAEYEDVDSLFRAVEIFVNNKVQVPKKIPTETNQEMLEKDPREVESEEDDETRSVLKVTVDPNSLKYIEDWRSRGSMEDPEKAKAKIEVAMEELDRLLHHMSFEAEPETNVAGHSAGEGADANAVAGSTVPQGGAQPDDELSDIPIEARELVRKEIANFRDRSTRREIERAKREEEMEAAEKLRELGRNGSRLDDSFAAVPRGPRAENKRAQIPPGRKGVLLTDSDGEEYFDEDSDTSSASDSELNGRQLARETAEFERQFNERLRKWLARERNQAAALEREHRRENDAESNLQRARDAEESRLAEYDDEAEMNRGVDEYFRNHSQWLHNRNKFRAREMDDDARDRNEEARELEAKQRATNRSVNLADRFLEEQEKELQANSTAREPARFTMSLGAAANKAQAAAAPRRTIVDVEGLLEDEEEDETQTTKRTLRPLAAVETVMGGTEMTDEERKAATRDLAKDIPNDKDGLWNWPLQWDYVDENIIREQLRPFVERKIMEYLGVQEEMLVDVVEEAIRKKTGPQDLVGELEGALDEEAEQLVKKLWRMVIFFSESERRGLSAR